MSDRRSVLFGMMGAVTLLCIGSRNASAKTYMDLAKSLLKKPPNGGRYRPDLESVIVSLTNSYRASEGKAALAPSDDLRNAARAHAADMMANGFIGHKASSGHGFDSRMRYFLGNPMVLPRMGENAARDSLGGPADAAKAKRLFNQWVKSRGHRKSMLSRDYQFMSAGVIESGGDIWAVQIFWANPPQTNLSGGLE